MIFFSLAGLLSTFFLSLMWMDTHTWGQAQHGPDPPDHFCVGHGYFGVRDRPELVTFQTRISSDPTSNSFFRSLSAWRENQGHRSQNKFICKGCRNASGKKGLVRIKIFRLNQLKIEIL